MTHEKKISVRDKFQTDKQLSYQEKERIADQYLMRVAGTCWADLADTNSLHDCTNRDDIILACDERLKNDTLDMMMP